MSKLLIDDRPLVLLPQLAAVVGVEEAIILQQIHFLCNSYKVGKELSDGFNYVWNTYEEWQKECFPFWSVATIKRKILALEKDGFLISSKPNSSDYDQTKYYRVNAEKIEKMQFEPINTDSLNLSQSSGSDCADQTDQIDPMYRNNRLLSKNRESAGVTVTKNGTRGIALNQSANDLLETYIAPLRNFYGGALADEFRWGNACARAIDAGLSAGDLLSALKKLMLQNRNYTITPENVLQSALEERAKKQIVKKPTLSETELEQRRQIALMQENYYAGR